jgi:quercetin dioxygenase-like cupin family protein
MIRNLHTSRSHGRGIGRAILATFVTLAAVVVLTVSAQGSGDAADPLAGTNIEALGSIGPDAAPDHALSYLRLTLAPGENIPAHHHPGAVVLVVESGLFETTFTEGEAVVMRSAGMVEERVSAGETALLEPDDSLAYENASHTMTNAGDGPLVLRVAALLAAGEPGFIFHDH